MGIQSQENNSRHWVKMILLLIKPAGRWGLESINIPEVTQVGIKENTEIVIDYQLKIMKMGRMLWNLK